LIDVNAGRMPILTMAAGPKRRRHLVSVAAMKDKPRNILLATDLTPAGDRAFDRAVQLARAWGAHLTVCHVIEASSQHPWGIERRVRNAEVEIDRLLGNRPLGVQLSRHTLIGDPAERAIAHAKAIGSDLVVTGPAQGKRLGERLLGSTAARIVRHATQPVLAVRRRPEGPYAAAVAAVDLSPPSTAAVLCSRSFFPEARLTLVHAYQVSPDWSGRDADRPVDEVEAEAKARVMRVAEQDMDDLAAGIDGAGGQIGKVLMQGTPDAVLGEYVDRHWPDVVVAGTHGRTGPRQDTIGSVAEQLLNTLPCDVLVVPARG
jgi:nucleotide-binding universal stress UspA family protein